MKATILVVEDKYLIARNIKNILEKEGYNVISEIESVEDAIVVLESQQVHLVLLDINLKKDKDGIELGHYLLAKATIPFIYITSYSDKITLDRAGETRPQGFLVKPFKAVDVITTVSIVLNNFSLKTIDESRAVEETTDDIPFILKNIIDYINENINKRIDLKELRAISRWESRHFQLVFTKYIGVTPLTYINKRKVEKAKTLLIETNIPTRQIGFEFGFKSHSHFCEIFKSFTDKNPDEYRKIHAVNKLRSKE